MFKVKPSKTRNVNPTLKQTNIYVQAHNLEGEKNSPNLMSYHTSLAGTYFVYKRFVSDAA